MAISVTELQQLRDDAVRNKNSGVTEMHFSDGRSLRWITTQEEWRQVIANLDAEIAAASGTTARPRFTLPTYSRD